MTLKEKIRHRYLVLEIDFKEAFSSKEFVDAIWEAIFKLFGEYGASKASIKLIDYDQKEKIAVISTTHKSLNMTRAALTSITKIADNPVAIHIIKVSGTLKTLKATQKQKNM